MITGKGFLQAYGRGLASAHRLHDALFGPFRLVGEDELRQRHRLFDANTAVTEVAPVALEELHGRRVMEIDVVLVGKDELDVAEGIACPRSLADAHLPALDSVESPLRESTADPAITADELEPLAGKVAWVAAQPGRVSPGRSRAARSSRG
jgi:hypothetical protein